MRRKAVPKINVSNSPVLLQLIVSAKVHLAIGAGLERTLHVEDVMLLHVLVQIVELFHAPLGVAVGAYLTWMIQFWKDN